MNVDELSDKEAAKMSPLMAPVFRGVAHLFAALRYSAHGFRACFVQEIAFRQECAIAIPHFLMVVLIPMELWMRFYLGSLWFVMISVELINTAIEAVATLTSPEWHELAKKAKDCGSAAVLSVIVVFSASWMFVIVRFLIRSFGK